MKGFLKKYGVWFFIALEMGVCWLIWPIIATFSSAQIQPIASAISTLAGILFGFMMGTISILTTATDNVLIRNTNATGYLPRLITKLHKTMGVLLWVCFIFLAILFVPDSILLPIATHSIKYSSLVMAVGVFSTLHAFLCFYFSWREFKKFSKHL